jgi:hypothetical protein
VVDFVLVYFYYPETSRVSLEHMQQHLTVDQVEGHL